MMPLRLLTGIVIGAALAGFAAGALSLRDPAPAPVPRASALEPAQVEPLPPAVFSGAERPRVPAGILARAADARALERAPSCPPPEAEQPLLCGPGQRESIEIEWHVAPQDP